MRGNLKLFELKSGRGEKLMKNILIISSSPRKKGNSQILCEQFKKGAEAKGHQVKIVRIMEQNIGFCRACDGCMRNGGTCVLKDDMAEILKMFQKADVLVLATPVYFYRYRGTPQGSVQARTLTRCSRKIRTTRPTGGLL